VSALQDDGLDTSLLQGSSGRQAADPGTGDDHPF